MENNERLMSDQIDQLATALSKAQAEFNIAELNQKNPFFKSAYADFESIVKASRASLTKYGLSVVQSVYRMTDGNTYLVTILLHSSGQWIKSQAQHNPAKTDVQSLSSYNTYLKRMCYSSLIGVVTGDIDDDGESAMIRQQPVYAPQLPLLTLDDKDYLMSLDEEKQSAVKVHFNVKNITDLNYNQFLAVKKKYSSK